MKFLVPESAPKYKRKWGKVCKSHLEALDSGEKIVSAHLLLQDCPKLLFPLLLPLLAPLTASCGRKLCFKAGPPSITCTGSFSVTSYTLHEFPPPDFWTVCLVHVFGFRLSERPSEARDSFLPLHAMGMPQHLLNFLTHVVCSWFIPNISVELTSPLTTALVCRLSCPSSPAVYT